MLELAVSGVVEVGLKGYVVPCIYLHYSIL